VLAGRNAGDIGDAIQRVADRNDVVRRLDLAPLEAEHEADEYLQNKQQLLHITIEPELRQNLLTLSGGKPILIDLAVEWRTRGISLNWMDKDLDMLSADELAERRYQFERQMVIHIAQCRRQMDDLILLMSRIYPLDANMIAQLMDMPMPKAEVLFQEASSYVFVKSLPDDSISLHDEMRRMIHDYVWEEVDPDGERRHYESQRVVDCVERKMRMLTQQIAELEEQTLQASKAGNAEAEFTAFNRREALNRELWMLKRQHLQHLFVIDQEESLRVFAENFDDATENRQFSFREALLAQMETYEQSLSAPKRAIVSSRRLKVLFDKGRYPLADELATKILEEFDISPEKRVETLVSRANTKIRLGDVSLGIKDFHEAVTQSQTHALEVWQFKALNGLGWAYRQTGAIDKAQQYYQQARLLYNTVNQKKKALLQDDFGWLSNNLAFVLSNDSQSRRTAVNIARANIEHWKMTGNEIGLGACYLVLGVAQYRYDAFESALVSFQQALNIFRPLELNDWLGQIYSWRGALYRDMDNLEPAENDLKKALEIGTSNIEAMTCYCLGRVYMTQERWNLAKEYMQKGLAIAKRIPDFRYWLATVTRLIGIAAEKRECQRLESLKIMIEECLAGIENPDKNALGIAYIGLSRLTLMHNDNRRKDTIVTLLKDGISLINASYYARADILWQLQSVEHDFHDVDASLIREVGQELLSFSSEKEQQEIDYIAVTPIMNKWALWEA
jgi:tetratricopeptide (TPR) repeat protein